MNPRGAIKSGLTCLVTYSLMPLIGWWLGGTALWPLDIGNILSSFFSDTARFAYLLTALGSAVLTFWLVYRLAALETSPLPKPPSIYWRNISLETVLLLGPFCDHRGIVVLVDESVLRWSGVFLFILGSGLRLWSGYLLTRAANRMKARPNEAILLVEGPFRWLRYPGFLATLVLSLGVALVFRSWIALGAVIFMLNFTVMRIKEEERAARLKYGLQWTAYSRNSWRLLPYIY